MPLPLFLLPALKIGGAALAGFVTGALFRQREINRLKKQVAILQNEIKRLQALIWEQNRQIKELRIRYNVMKGYHFVNKIKYEGSIKGYIIQAYAFQEYVRISCDKINKDDVSADDGKFFVIYDKILSDGKAEKSSYAFIKTYLLKKYELEISQMIPPSGAEMINAIEVANVA